MKFGYALVVSLVLVFSLVGCAGNYYPNPKSLSTLEGINMAINETPNTIRAIKGNVIAFGWPDIGGIRFAMLNYNLKRASTEIPQIVRGGTLVGATAKDIEQILQQDGWKLVGKYQIPLEVLTAVETAGSWLVYISSGMTTFLLTIAPDSAIITATPTNL